MGKHGQQKMYITGGIGSRHDGEAFGANYELPNLTAYNETCAAIGDVYWNHRLHNLYGASKYFDVIERTMYNGLISGISLDGKQFFTQMLWRQMAFTNQIAVLAQDKVGLTVLAAQPI